MKTNRHGSAIQEIVLRVAAASSDVVSHQLGIPAHEDATDPSSRKLVWTRLARHLGDDEGVVYDLSRDLGRLAHTVKWEIDWRASRY